MTHPDFNPGLHPRGRGGRFTRSFSHRATPAQKQRGHDLMTRFSPTKDGDPLAGISGDKNAVNGFSSNFTTVNATLRAGGTDTPEITALDRAMKPLPHDTELIRAVPLSQFGSVKPSALTGFVVRDAGFFPTNIQAPSQNPAGSVIMRIQAPAGTRAAADPDTGQVVLDRGTDMLVQGVQDTAVGAEMALTVLPVGDTPTAPADTTPAEPATTPPVGQDFEFDDEPPRNAAFDARVERSVEGPAVRSSVSHSLLSGRNLTDHQAEGLQGYIEETYQPINHVLRGGSGDLSQFTDDTAATREQVDNWIAGVDSAMEQSRLPHESAVWRGLDATRIFGDAFEQDMTGLEWREDAYSSTTTDARVARRFAGRRPGATMMQVVVPQGVGAVELSGEEYESELLLQRGLRFRVVTDHGYGDDGTRWLDVEVIPDGG